MPQIKLDIKPAGGSAAFPATTMAGTTTALLAAKGTSTPPSPRAAACEWCVSSTRVAREVVSSTRAEKRTLFLDARREEDTFLRRAPRRRHLASTRAEGRTRFLDARRELAPRRVFEFRRRRGPCSTSQLVRASKRTTMDWSQATSSSARPARRRVQPLYHGSSGLPLDARRGIN